MRFSWIYSRRFHLSAEEAELQVKLISTRGNKEIEFGEFKAWWMNDARVENLKWDGEELGKVSIGFFLSWCLIDEIVSIFSRLV